MASIAHTRDNKEGKEIQSLKEHLFMVSRIAGGFSNKIGLKKAGELLGLIHDLGKYSEVFQNYIGSATGIISSNNEKYVDANRMKGKIDHSTAGAQYIWNFDKAKNKQYQIIAQLLSLCVISHHSGLIDCISPEGENEFEKRMSKNAEKTFFEEVLQKADYEIIKEIDKLLSDKNLLDEFLVLFKNILIKSENVEALIRIQSGILVRFLFSCLIDADRLDTSDFEEPSNKSKRQAGQYLNWDILINRLEDFLKRLEEKKDDNRISLIRKLISDSCRNRGEDSQGIFTLTVPTGGGKTLSSLRFALYHARKHKLDRIIYILPFTTIIDQNAEVVRAILETKEEDKWKIVLEHHSNILPELLNMRTKLLAENWDSPIVFTTTVQFLDTIFGGGTRSVRRMHQLARSVIIFDEIQALPVKTIHLFNNAANFLVNYCHSTLVLCTATQPLLNGVDIKKGKLSFSEKDEIVPNYELMFNNLKRVQVKNICKPVGWKIDEIADLSIKQLNNSSKSCLVIVNTKRFARLLFETIQEVNPHVPVFHLSTSMCPVHRLLELNNIKRKLQNKEPLICVSTQLIEAGVDIDFDTVIRFVAGLDSIVQAAGRCNRNGTRKSGTVYILNPSDEIIDSLEDIKVGKEISLRILNELGNLTDEIIYPKTLERYFQYFFYNRAELMDFPVDIERDDNLLTLLGTNMKSVSEHCRINGRSPDLYFRQSFNTAAEKFKTIEAPTLGVIVPYTAEGQRITNEFYSQFATEKINHLLQIAQRFTVNVFPHILKKLIEKTAVHQIADLGIYILSDKRYYHDKFGLTTEAVSELETIIH